MDKDISTEFFPEPGDLLFREDRCWLIINIYPRALQIYGCVLLTRLQSGVIEDVYESYFEFGPTFKVYRDGKLLLER